jgi:curved DNA-binding protein CbpA
MEDIDEANIDPYLHLGLKPEASEKEIKSAYRKKSLVLHPDKVRSPPSGSSRAIADRSFA